VLKSTTAMTGMTINPVTGEIIDRKELAERLLAQAKERLRGAPNAELAAG
jgi:putative transposase